MCNNKSFINYIPYELTSFQPPSLVFISDIIHFRNFFKNTNNQGTSVCSFHVLLCPSVLYLSGQNKKGRQLNNESEKAFVKTKAYVCCQNKVSFFYSCTHFFRLNFLLVLSHVLLVDGVLLDDMFFKAVIQSKHFFKTC